MNKPSNAMLDIRQAPLILCTAFLLLLSACRADGNRSTQRGTMASIDTTRLQEIYRGMEQDHSQLMARYEEMQGQMPADMQQMYQHLRQMHGEASAMHQQMMRGSGMMHGEGMMDDEGMMGQGAGMMGIMGTREWDQQMLGMHEGLAQMHGHVGQEEMAQMHRQMSEWYRQAIEATPSEGSLEEGPPAPEDAALNGANLYAQQCAACHGAQGGGGGTFPPLAGSEWVTGDEETPTRIVLHGLQGSVQVEGTTYNGVMPAFGSRLADAEIAAILTHIRSSWENDAPEVTADEVQEVRREYSGRTQSWSASDFR